MSLETILAENTAAVLRLTAAIEESNKGRAAALDALAAKQSGDDAPKRTRAAKEKTATEAEKAPEKAAEKAPETPAVPSLDDLRAAATEFLGAKSEAERAKRKGFMKQVIDHLQPAEDEKGKRPLVNVKPEERASVIQWFKDFAEGKEVSFGGAAEQDDDDIG